MFLYSRRLYATAGRSGTRANKLQRYLVYYRTSSNPPRCCVFPFSLYKHLKSSEALAACFTYYISCSYIHELCTSISTNHPCLINKMQAQPDEQSHRAGQETNNLEKTPAGFESDWLARQSRSPISSNLLGLKRTPPPKAAWVSCTSLNGYADIPIQYRFMCSFAFPDLPP